MLKLVWRLFFILLSLHPDHNIIINLNLKSMNRTGNVIDYAMADFTIAKHEKKVLLQFINTPSEENVASVILEIGGIEYLFVIDERDYIDLFRLLMKINEEKLSLYESTCKIKDY